MPRTFSDMVREGIAGQMESARQKHYSLFELTNLLFEEGNPAGVKAGLELKGICEPSVRLPLIEASSELKEKIALIVSNWTD
jgi:4-hydroxy-tetrahydrodipicolinate synthase